MPLTSTPRVAAFCLALALSPLVNADVPTGVQSAVLLKSSASWEGTPYPPYPASTPELSVVKISITANSALDWHEHPMPNAAYVLSGELTIETRDLAHRKVFQAGEVVAEVVGRQHRGFTGTAPVELVVFYAGSAGMPLSK